MRGGGTTKKLLLLLYFLIWSAAPFQDLFDFELQQHEQMDNMMMTEEQMFDDMLGEYLNF